MGKMTKFSSQMDADVLKELRDYASAGERKLSGVLTEAVRLFLGRARVRPAFHDAALQVIHEHDELFERLAK